MTANDLHNLKKWFFGYTRSFYSDNPEDQKNISLKEKHSAHVCANIVRIATEEGLNRNQVLLAEAIGLLHDAGRFPQYAEYKTFRDSISVNHGELGARVIIDKAVLNGMTKREQDIITTAVKFHNTYSVPALDDSEAVLFLKLIRDADKLDIWRIFFEYYGQDEQDKPSAVGLGLPDTDEYSPEVLARIFEKQLVPLTMLRTINDFKLTKLSWIYDLNFKVTLRIVVEKDYINRIASTLPHTDEIVGAIAFLHKYVEEKLKGDIHE